MRVFFACPMTDPVESKDSAAIEDYFAQLRMLLAAIRADPTRSAFCAFEAEDWGAEVPAAGVLTRRDFQEMRRSDVLVALFTSSLATSVLIEIGWAMERQIPIVTCQRRLDRLPILVSGIKTVTRTQHIYYDSRIEELRASIVEAIDRLMR